MPVTFSFNDANTFATSVLSSGSPTDVSTVVDGVRFTLSIVNNSGNFIGVIGTTTAGVGDLTMRDLNSDDTFLLTFRNTASTSLNILQGTAANPIALNVTQLIGPGWKAEFLNGTAVVATQTITGAGSTTLAGNNTITGIRFSSTGGSASSESLGIKAIGGNALTCFAPGTRIATPDGARAVETLRPGDLVRTSAGADRPVVALRENPVSGTFQHPDEINPIRIRAGALGQGLPLRDLHVTPDHGVLVDGHIVNAEALVNGTSITRAPGRLPEGYCYYHIDTGAHEVLLAEGLEVESYLATDGSMQELPLPRVTSSRLLLAARAA